MLSLLELFCHVDDFCQQAEQEWTTQRLSDGATRRDRGDELMDKTKRQLMM